MPGALEGLKVVDLSRVLGGPYCAQMLADHGAEVIKIEPPQGDETRLWGPPFDQEGISAYFAGINRNKRTVALDLSKPEGREVLLKLLETADVLIENFKTGTMEKWGIGYDDAVAEVPAPGPCPRLGLRRRRPAGRLPGLRRHGAGLGRAGLGQRRARGGAGAHRRAGGRSVDRHECLHGHPDGALRAQPLGQGPVRRRHALRQRRRAAPAARAQLLHGRAEAQALRQQPRQPRALRQLPDQGPQHRDRRRQ